MDGAVFDWARSATPAGMSLAGAGFQQRKPEDFKAHRIGHMRNDAIIVQDLRPIFAATQHCLSQRQ
jgi:hypothetical protein